MIWFSVSSWVGFFSDWLSRDPLLPCYHHVARSPWQVGIWDSWSTPLNEQCWIQARSRFAVQRPWYRGLRPFGTICSSSRTVVNSFLQEICLSTPNHPWNISLLLYIDPYNRFSTHGTAICPVPWIVWVPSHRWKSKQKKLDSLAAQLVSAHRLIGRTQLIFVSDTKGRKRMCIFIGTSPPKWGFTMCLSISVFGESPHCNTHSSGWAMMGCQ